jgi:hypothetical protein
VQLVLNENGLLWNEDGFTNLRRLQLDNSFGMLLIEAGDVYLLSAIVISIINFKLFERAEYHSKFLLLEAARYILAEKYKEVVL